MNLPAFLRREPHQRPRPWPFDTPRFDLAAMKATIQMEDDMSHLVHSEFAPKPHPRNLDQDQDLFDAGLVIAAQVIDWEETSGKSISVLVDHIKNTRKLRAQVIADANGEEPQS